jgi:hypothetical protein
VTGGGNAPDIVGDASDPPASDASTTDEQEPGDGFSVRTMLEQVPLDLLPEDDMYLTMGDLDNATELAGVERPPRGSPADAAANDDAVRAVFEEGRSVFSGQPLRELVELDDVVVDGPTIVATFRMLERSPRMIWQMVIGRDLPATHR